MNAVQKAARAMSDYELIHARRKLNAELLAVIKSGVNATHAHMAMIEMAQACADELLARNYAGDRKADGSDLPVDICHEDGIRYSFSVRCF